MLLRLLSGALFLTSASCSVFKQPLPLPPKRTLSQRNAKEAKPNTAFFDQFIDHSKPSLGTFKQRYYWSDEFYIGPGSPVVLMTPGESAIDGYDGYLSNETLPGVFAQEIGGAAIILEHRYWGESSPYQSLTPESLQYQTLNNSIHDLTNFANKVDLPFDKNGSSSAGNAPWVLSGGSYAGALTSWTNVLAPGTFWAYHATSAVVEAISDFYTYEDPIMAGMAQNCSTDVAKVVNRMDGVLKEGSKAEIEDLKNMFGLESVEWNDDFMGVLKSGPYAWQGKSLVGDYTGFEQFCDFVENQNLGSNATMPGPEGVGLEKALDGYARYVKTTVLPGYCAGKYYEGDDNLECLDSHNGSHPEYHDLGVDNQAMRQWVWMLCNEPFEWWQAGPSTGQDRLISRYVDVPYWARPCSYYFGEDTYGLAQGLSASDVNSFTGGWTATDTTRLVWVNGEFDPWRPSTVSSETRPGGPLESTEDAPVWIVPGGIHCSDYYVENGDADEGVKEVIDGVVKQIKSWVDEFYEGDGKGRTQWT